MSNYQIAIKNLSWITTERRLRSLFSRIGEVLDVTVIKNSLGESIGDAFITMRNKSDAENAINVINGKEVDGKAIRVKASPLNERNLTKAILLDA